MSEPRFRLEPAYLSEVRARGYRRDPAQLALATEFERLGGELARREHAARRFPNRLISRLRRAPPVRGVYAWGGVGRGKTFLMDLFFDRLPIAAKRRAHFHRFMLSVHRDLNRLKSTKDPLREVAGDLAADARCLCLDELFVEDITDAMVLAGLFRELIGRGVALVFTSNSEPGDLYRDGLQRERFLPAIELLRRHCVVHHLDGGTDHRLRALESTRAYLCPHDAAAQAALDALFTRLSGGRGVSTAPLHVAGRELPLCRSSEGVAWFEFADLCEGPRSKADYTELSRLFNTVIVSGVPLLGASDDAAARRFIELVDELYDRRVNVVVSAAAPPRELYRGRRLRRAFERTASRLREFGDPRYLGMPHRP